LPCYCAAIGAPGFDALEYLASGVYGSSEI
jgi:hypothetical protein